MSRRLHGRGLVPVSTEMLENLFFLSGITMTLTTEQIQEMIRQTSATAAEKVATRAGEGVKTEIQGTAEVAADRAVKRALEPHQVTL